MKRKRDMNHDISKTSQVVLPEWQPPAHGQLKLNVDASLYSSNNFYSIGMVLRDESGDFIGGKTMKLPGKVSVLDAEAKGVQEAIKWLEELPLLNVVVECDSEMVVKAVNNGILYHMEVGHILEWCRLKFKYREDISLSHVKKQANRAAHLMARVPCLLNGCITFSSPPSLLLENLSSISS